MLIRYLMFFILGFLMFGAFFIYRKKNIPYSHYIAFAVVMYVLGMITMIQVIQTTLFTDTYEITVLDAKNEKSSDTEVYIHSLMIDTREIEIPDITVENGKWIYDGECYIYLPELDGVSRKISLKIPVGKARSIRLSKEAYCGIVKIECQNVFENITDLYSEYSSVCEILLPESDNKYVLGDRIIKLAAYCMMLLGESVVLFCIIEKSTLWIQNLLKNKKRRYFLLMLIGFAGICLQEMRTPDGLVSGGYQDTFWFESYELGYLSRGLIGEIVNSISAYWTVEQLFLVKIAIAFLFLILVALCVSSVVGEWKMPWMSMVIAGLLTTFPYSRLIFADDIRSDVVLLLLYVLSVMAIYHDSVTLLFIPMLSILIILCNETTCLTIFPSILALLLYRWSRDKEKRYIIIFLATTVIGMITTYLTASYGKGGNMPLETTFDNMEAHYGGVLNQSALAAEYWTIHDHLKLVYTTFLENWIVWLLFGILLVPGIVLIAAMLKAIYIKCKIGNNLWEKWCFFLLILCAFSPLSAMAIAIDHPRYALIISTILLADVLFVAKLYHEEIFLDEMTFCKVPLNTFTMWPLGVVIFYAAVSTFSATIESSLSHIVAWVNYFEHL